MAISASRTAITANSSAPPRPPIAAPSGMQVKNTSMLAWPSKLVVLKISTQARPAAIPNAAPPSAPSTKPSRPSNAIFMDVSNVVEGGAIDFHEAIVAAVAEVAADVSGHGVAFGDDDQHFVAHAGISLVDGLPNLPDFGFAAAIAQTRQVS